MLIIFILAIKSTQLGSYYKFCLTFYGWWFQCQFICSFCYAVWIFPSCVTRGLVWDSGDDGAYCSSVPKALTKRLWVCSATWEWAQDFCQFARSPLLPGMSPHPHPTPTPTLWLTDSPVQKSGVLPCCHTASYVVLQFHRTQPTSGVKWQEKREKKRGFPPQSPLQLIRFSSLYI